MDQGSFSGHDRACVPQVKSLPSANGIQATCWGWSLVCHITFIVLSQTIPDIY